MVRNLLLSGLFLPLFFHQLVGQHNVLRQSLLNTLQESGEETGVAIMDLDTKDTISVDGHRPYPMQSVYKFPLALAVLHSVDEGKLSLEQKILITKKDFFPNTWSPLRDKYPDGNVEVSLSEILRSTVSQSDNIGCDILFRLMGGPDKVDKLIHNLGLTGIAIANTEQEMHSDWNIQFSNWCEPVTMTQMLRLVYEGKVLSVSSNEFLMKVMTETTTGPNRIKGLLPKEASVAHKTGTSGQNQEGLTAAINDVGIVTLPNGRKFAISVFVTNSKSDPKKMEAVIASITKQVWDYFSTK